MIFPVQGSTVMLSYSGHSAIIATTVYNRHDIQDHAANAVNINQPGVAQSGCRACKRPIANSFAPWICATSGWKAQKCVPFPLPPLALFHWRPLRITGDLHLMILGKGTLKVVLHLSQTRICNLECVVTSYHVWSSSSAWLEIVLSAVALYLLSADSAAFKQGPARAICSEDYEQVCILPYVG